MRSRRAFTLVELIIAVFIFSYIAASLATIYSTTNRHMFQNYRRNVIKTDVLVSMRSIQAGLTAATRLDLPDAIRLSSLIEPLEPYFVEDLVRSENPGVYRQLRPLVKVPIAVGEQFGDRWDINELIEGRLIDYSRVSLPNCGGITEFVKHAAICETHYVGLVPHFTGPVSEAALVHCCAVFSGPVLMEMRGNGPLPATYLTDSFDFRNGKLWPNARPGLGVAFNPAGLKLLAEADRAAQPVPQFRRPDGSLTNW